MVAMTWCEGYKPGLTVNHIDGNTMNNTAENLEWVSLKENIQKGFNTGMYKKNQKGCKLVDENGKEYEFPSQSSASRFLGRNEKYINCKFGKKYEVAYDANGNKYKIIY